MLRFTADLSKTERGPISTNGHSIIQYITEPGDSRGEINPFFLAGRRRTLDHSLVAGGAQRQSLQACLPDGHTAQCLFSACSPLLSLISRNSPKQLGMVSTELCQRFLAASKTFTAVVFRPRRSPDRGSPVTRRRSGRGKGSLLNSASLTLKPLASSVYVHVLEAPSPLKRSILVTSPFSLPRIQDDRMIRR